MTTCSIKKLNNRDISNAYSSMISTHRHHIDRGARIGHGGQPALFVFVILLMGTLLALPARGQNLLVDSSFEDNPLGNYHIVLNNFVSQQGVWGPETGGSITGPDSGVTPFHGSKMLRLLNCCGSYIQVVQVTDVTSYGSLIDSGVATVNLSARLNASSGVTAAVTYVRVAFYTEPNVTATNGLIQNSPITLDNDPGTWEHYSISGTIPAATRWLVTEVGFLNSTLGSGYGYVDAVELTISNPQNTLFLSISAEDQYAIYHKDTASGTISWVTPPDVWVEGVHTPPVIETWAVPVQPGDFLYVAARNASALPEPHGGMMVARATIGSTVAETGMSELWQSSNQMASPNYEPQPFPTDNSFLLGVINGGWFTPAVGAVAGAAPGWPGGPPDPTASLAPARFIWAQPGGGSGWGFSGYTSPGIAMLRLSVPVSCPFPCCDLCNPPCPPGLMFHSVGIKSYQINGTANNIPWSWRLVDNTSGDIIAADCLVAGVDPTEDVDGSGTGGLAGDVARRFADSINAYAAANGCSTVLRAQSSSGTTSGSPAHLSLQTSLHKDDVTLYVGPGGDCADCAVVFQIPSAPCPFNPDIEELLLPGEDCDGNGWDDILDIVLFGAADNNGNGIPDVCEVELTSADPGLHFAIGGDSVHIYGTGLTPDLLLTVNDVPLTDVIFISQRKLIGRLPPNPPGTYDLVAKNAQTLHTLAVLPDAIEYIAESLPPLVDIEVAHMGSEVRMRWANLVPFDRIDVHRNDLLVAMLPGDSTSFVDDVSGLPTDQPVEYRLQGFRDTEMSLTQRFVSSHPLQFDAVDTLCVFRPCGSGQIAYQPSQAATPPVGRRVQLSGQEANVARTCFVLPFGTSRGLDIKIHVARIHRLGTLRARILDTSGNPVGDPPAVNILVPDLPVSPAAQFRRIVYLGELAAGQYVMELYVPDGFDDKAHFSVSLDASVIDAGPPFPCPGYVYAQVSCLGGGTPPVCGGFIYTNYEQWLGGGVGICLAADPQLVYDPDPGDYPEKFQWMIDNGNGYYDVSDWLASWSTAREVPGPGVYNVNLSIKDTQDNITTCGRTIAVQPYLPPATEIQITHLSPWCSGSNAATIIPDLPDLDVIMEFTAFVTGREVDATTTTEIILVEFEFRDTSTAIVLGPFAATPLLKDSLEQTYWTVPINVSQLPRLSVIELRVRATDNSSGTKTVACTLTLCPKPEFLEIPFVEPNISYAGGKYTVEGAITQESVAIAALNQFGIPPGTIPYITQALENLIQFNLSAKMHLEKRKWRADTMKFELASKFFSKEFSETYERNPLYQSTSCPDFSVQYQSGDITILDREWGPQRVIDHVDILDTCFPVPPFFVCVDLELTIDLAWFAKVLLNLAFELNDASPFMALETCLRPSAGLTEGTRVILDAEIDPFGVDLSIRGLFEMGLGLPVKFRYQPPTNFHLFPPGVCFHYDVDIDLCIPTFNIGCLGPWGLAAGNMTSGDGCGDPCVDFKMSTLGVDESPPFVPIDPTVAQSPDGAHSMMVFVRDSDPEDGLRKTDLMFSVNESEPALLWPADEHLDSQPNVVFLNNTTAILTWTQNSLTYSEMDAISPGLEGINALLNSQEIYAAAWTVGSGWGPKVALTDDDLCNGFPKVAAIAGTNSAWVVFVGHDSDVFSEDAGLNSQSGIWAQRVGVDGMPLGVAVRLSAVGSNFGPTIGSAREVAVGYAAWVHHDNTGRRLVTARFDGQVWQIPVDSFGTPDYSGVDMPSIALSDDGSEGALAFMTGAPEELGKLHIGMMDELYVSRFSTALPRGPIEPPNVVSLIDRCAQAATAAPFPGTVGPFSWPNVFYLNNHALAVGFRSFWGTHGAMQYGGEVGLAMIDYSAPSPEWSARIVTNSNERNMEMAFARDLATGGIMAAWNSTGGNLALGGLMTQTFPVAPDLEISRVRFANRLTPPGRNTKVTVTVRNAGLVRQDGPSVLRIGTVEADQFFEIATIPIQFDLYPDEQSEYEFTMVAPPETTLVRVTADPIMGELNTENNSAEATLGVLPPQDLTCFIIETEKNRLEVALTWQNSEPYETIIVYRNGQSIATLSGDSIAFVDSFTHEGVAEYSVRGMVGFTRSDRDGAVCLIYVCHAFDGDGNRDGYVNGADIQGLVDAIVTGFALSGSTCAYDLNSDGSVDINDVPLFVEAILQK